MSEDSNSIKKRIEELVTNSKVIDKNNEKLSSTILIQKLFEVMGWKYDTDVRIENFENTTVKAFQIDNVTRFYLKEFTTDSLETVTNDIKSVVSYAYNRGVTWAVISNFNEMRIYNTESQGKTLASMLYYSFTSLEYIEKFEKVSDLSKKQFSLNVLDDNAEYFGKKPKRVSIDKQLLEDILEYRNILTNDMTKENSVSGNDAEFAAQKILNRLIFIRSCADRQIENRFLKEELHKWEEKKDKKLIYHLQDIFSYFRGRYGSTLFEKHLCDDLIISDKVLHQVIEGTYQSKKKAVRYNFAHIEHDSLGKMYENYLGTVQQKKDGAYYTPSYISKYICENTIIPYLSKSEVTNIPDLILEYSGNLEELEAKLSDIKILDPACGTGEFLIRAIDVLLEISSEIQAKKEADGQYTHTVRGKKSGTVSYQTFGKDIENKEIRRIIQNNIYGVDINEEAIEITKLNMFLKLATSSQQLIDLSKNVMVGNSLIDDPKIDPSALDWNKEFPEKFDIIIGNPPYIRVQRMKYDLIDYCFKNYFSPYKKFDLSLVFIEKSLQLVKKEGVIGYITSSQWMKTDYGTKLRKLLKGKINKIIDFGSLEVFKNAKTYPAIFIIESENSHIHYKRIKDKIHLSLSGIEKYAFIKKSYSELTDKAWTFFPFNLISFLTKSKTTFSQLTDYGHFYTGALSGLDDVFIVTEKIIKEKNLEEEILLPYAYNASEVNKFAKSKPTKKIIYPYKPNSKGDAVMLNENELKQQTPNIHAYLNQYKEALSKRKDSRKFYATGKNWYKLLRPGRFQYVTSEKLLVKGIEKSIVCGYLEKNSLFSGANTPGFILEKSDEDSRFFIGLFNSKLISYYLCSICPEKLHGYFRFNSNNLNLIPIPNNMDISIKKSIADIVEKLTQSISNDSVNQNEEIEKNQNEINNLVYKLYNISDEEKAIIESSV